MTLAYTPTVPLGVLEGVWGICQLPTDQKTGWFRQRAQEARRRGEKKKQKTGVPRRLRPRGRPQVNFRLPPPPQGLLRRLPATEAVWLSCRFFVFRIFGGLTRIGEIADDVWENWMYRWWFRLSSQCRERSNQLQINVVSKERIYKSRSQCCQRDSLVTMV